MFQGKFSDEETIHCPANRSVSHIKEDHLETFGPGIMIGVTMVIIMVFMLLIILSYVLWKRYFNAMYYYLNDPGNEDDEDNLNMNDEYEEL